jgi:prepilin-type N-terminal cleavage/methylation domain-containing protein
MTNHRKQSRRGFTLIELLVGIVIFAIIGALFTKLLTVQGKFFDRQGMGNAARNVSRASLNRVVSDFRMIEATGGVIAASPTSLTLRIPFAIGVVCKGVNGGTALSLLPVDSTTYVNASYYGYAWRGFQNGAYRYVESGSSRETGNPADCASVLITTVTGGKNVLVKPPVPPDSAGLGTPVFLYSRIRYDFKASTAVPGKLGLWLNGGATAQANPPATLSNIRGLELHLDGMSETIAPGQVTNEKAPFTTAVYFKNRIN